MLQWLSENLASILVSAAVLAAVAVVLTKLIRDRRAGKRSCGCSCSGCSGCEKCTGKQR